MRQYRIRSVVVEAQQIDVRTPISTSEGVVTGQPGDWLVYREGFEPQFFSNFAFQSTFEPVPDKRPEGEELVCSRCRAPACVSACTGELDSDRLPLFPRPAAWEKPETP